MKSKLKDAIVGLALADALGVPVEFQSRENLKYNPVVDMREYGTYNQPKGTWSDDTTMTLALLDSLIYNEVINYDDIIKRFASWFYDNKYTAHDEVFDVGITTRESILRFVTGTPALESGGNSEFDNGNGSLMRIIPVLFYLYKTKGIFDYTDDSFNVIHNVSNLTHRHIRSHIACGIYVSVAHEIIKYNDLKKGIKQGIKKSFKYYSMQDDYKDELIHFNRLNNPKFENILEEDINSGGYVVHSLEASLWCLFNTTSYKEAVLKAVNLGEDTDTTGALSSLVYTYEEIPKEWLEALVRREYVEDLCAEYNL